MLRVLRTCWKNANSTFFCWFMMKLTLNMRILLEPACSAAININADVYSDGQTCSIPMLSNPMPQKIILILLYSPRSASGLSADGRGTKLCRRSNCVVRLCKHRDAPGRKNGSNCDGKGINIAVQRTDGFPLQSG